MNIRICDINIGIMLAQEIAKILINYRKRNNLSQSVLANQLGLTQATVSRIERGRQTPKPSHIERILGLIPEDVSKSSYLNKWQEDQNKQSTSLKKMFVADYEKYKSGWNYFKASLPFGGKSGGDILVVKELQKQKHLGILIGDSVGHGLAASYMSFALEFGYTTIASAFTPSLLSPKLFDRLFAMAITETPGHWRGEPSIITLQIDLESSHVSFINRGMPYPIKISSSNPELLNEHRASAFGLKKITHASTNSLFLESGESLLLYSDGFLDLVPEKEITTIIQKLSRLFKGDSRAIGRNIIRHMESNIKERALTDDVSFLIISKAKKGRRHG